MSFLDTLSQVITCKHANNSENIYENCENREFYINIIQGKGRKPLEKLEKLIINPILCEHNIKPGELVQTNVRSIQMSKKMEYTDHKIIGNFTIGRSETNKITINDGLADISRIHCAVFFANNKIIILDTWSLTGTTVIKGSPRKEITSKYGSRKIISFNIGTKFLIKINNFTLIFNNNFHTTNTKECIICCQNKRSTRFNCGHSTTCDECTGIIMKGNKECPICRTIINSIFPTDTDCTFTT